MHHHDATRGCCQWLCGPIRKTKPSFSLQLCFRFRYIQGVNRNDDALEVLRGAERDLRRLMSDAAAAGDYENVVRIAALARAVHGVASGSDDVKTRAKNYSDRPAETRPPAAGTGRPKTSPEYPQFFRDHDRVLRVAWSKEKKKEYEHRAPHSMLHVLAAAIEEKGADGRVFSSDEILPLVGAGGAEIPSYQAYLGLSLLKKVGLLDQHGRQGYSIPEPSKLQQAVEAVWRHLPQK